MLLRQTIINFTGLKEVKYPSYLQTVHNIRDMKKAACYLQKMKYHALIWPSMSDFPLENHYICLSWVFAKPWAIIKYL